MQAQRRMIATLAGLAPIYAIAGDEPSTPLAYGQVDRLVLSDFSGEDEFVIPGANWRGFSDRVMGGVSDATFSQDVIDGKRCARMTGTVTRDNGGGFIQMALDLPRSSDASPYRGVELLVYGNDEDYNVHIRTADCGWYDQSYRATFRADSRWQTVRLPWSAFKPNGVNAELDTSRLERLGLLGWMREFQADLAIGAVALYA